MKALWTGSITFALVSIPVKLYAATRKRDVRFHMLHKRCSTPLHYDRRCETCQATVPWEDVAHGYEFEKGKFVVVTDEELDSLPTRTARTIEIVKFADPAGVEPIYYETAYYIEPLEGGEKAYALLRETMRATGKVPLSKVTMRGREHPSVIALREDALTLHTLYYADEALEPAGLNIPGKVKLDPRETALAEDLVRKFAGSFDIAEFQDASRKALLTLVKAKVEGREVKVAPSKEARKVVSLMEALKKSLKKTGKTGAPAIRRRKAG